MSAVAGRCLCGAVVVTAEAGTEMGVCHCGMCRRSGGGALFATELARPPTVAGDENVSVYRSSDWAERAFCARCGTWLWYRLVEVERYLANPWLFEDAATRFRLVEQIFVDDRPASYAILPEGEQLTGAEVVARFGETEP